MGHRSWLTFTKTATEASVLASNLEKIHEEADWEVYGVYYVLNLNEPYKRDLHFAVAWSGQTGSQLNAKGHVCDTVFLDEMAEEWADNPETFGKKLTVEQLREIVRAETSIPDKPRDTDGSDRAPSKALWAISDISAFLGRGINYESSSGGLVGWRGTGSGDLAFLSWDGETVKVSLAPANETDWKLAYQIMGYCACHGIECNKP